MSRILLEVSVASVECARAAERGGADRLEVCSALDLGGLTPSPELLRAIRDAVSLPLAVMVRPHARGFAYSDADREEMSRAIESLPADAHVFGALTATGDVDESMPGPGVFHRAFDEARGPFASLETLIRLGFGRLLTSGQAPTALDGKDLIRRLIERSAGRIEILPGAGVRSRNVAELVRATGCTQVHGTFRTAGRCDEEEVRRVRSVLDSL